jgi:hypothetical protein
MELGAANRPRPGGLMSAQRNKVHHVTTIARVAIELGEDEDWLWQVADEMETEDGLIWVYGPGDDGVMAFSDEGIECLQELIALHKANPKLISTETNQE